MIPDLPSPDRIDTEPQGERPDIWPDPGGEVLSESMQLPTERMVGLGFLRASLLRSRKWWLGAAAAGLLVGVMYHVVVPLKYAATATVYLANPTSANATVAANNDLAMLQTHGVAARALAMLDEPGLTANGLLGKAPGTLLSDNVLQVAVYGPSSQVAVRRVNALTSAYLSFRAHQYTAQNDAVVAAVNSQVASLQSKIDHLSAVIAQTTAGQVGTLSSLEAERQTAQTQLTNLKTSIRNDNLDTLAITKGTRELASGSAVPLSTKKVFLLDGLTGLAAGLGGSLFILIVLAFLSDRVWRREDVAAVLGAPVGASVGHVGGRRPWTRRSVLAMAARPDRELSALVRYLRWELHDWGGVATELVVPIGNATAPAAALVVLTSVLRDEGNRVVLVDATHNRVLARAFRRECVGVHAVDAGQGLGSITLVVASPPGDRIGSDGSDVELARAKQDVVLVLGTADPTVGASQLRQGGNRAVLTVSAGRARVQELTAAAELMEASGIAIGSAALLGSERHDDSVGLPLRGAAPARRGIGALRVPTQPR